MLKKLNIVHIVIILALPIVLALINPNWLFNTNIVDDYLYLGYQLDFPKYVGWSLSSDSYEIERIVTTLPGYWIRQFVSPLMANFILHLGVYYLAVFSFYAILNRLFHPRVGLIVVLLFGQYPIIMRATGWDYVDGYAMAFFTLTVLFLTYSIGSSRQTWYLVATGGAFALTIVAHIVSLFYLPALVTYYLLLNNWRDPIKKSLIAIFFSLVGLVGAYCVMAWIYCVMAWIYYAMTGRILLQNSLVRAQTDTQWFQRVLNFTFSRIEAHWHFLLIIVASVIIFSPLMWKKLGTIPTHHLQLINYRVVMRALVGLFALSYLVFVIWYFRGYIYIKVSFYHTILVMQAFLLIGAFFAQRLIHIPQNKFKYVLAGAFFIPMMPFAIFSLTPHNLLITNYWILYTGAIICLCIVLYPRRTIYALFGFAMFTGAMLHDARGYRAWIHPTYHDVYVADRYLHQTMYEYVIRITDIISARYETFDYETFRLWYPHIHDTHWRLFNSVAAVYLWKWDRVLKPDTIAVEGQKSREIIVMASLDNIDRMITELQNAVSVTELDRHRLLHPSGDFEIIFFRVNRG